MKVLEMSGRFDTKEDREKLFEELYETAFPAVATFISKMNGSFQDAKDIFQDALVIYFDKSVDPKFSTRALPEHYILGIAKHLWIRKFNADRNVISLTKVEQAISIPSDYFPSIRSNQLLQFVENAGKKCLDLLRGFYFEKLSMRNLAETFGYKGERSVTVQKYKCLEKLRESLKAKSMTYEDFFE